MPVNCPNAYRLERCPLMPIYAVVRGRNHPQLKENRDFSGTKHPDDLRPLCKLEFVRCVKYPYRQPTSNSNLGRHRRAVIERDKYPCRQCDHHATSEWHLAQHIRAVHEGVNTLADNATTKQLQRDILLNIQRQFMKESNILADYAMQLSSNKKGRSC